MALKLTPEDLEFLRQKGIDPADIVELPPDKMSAGRAATSTLKAHAGGIAGGGAATLGGVMLAPETGGLSLLIPIIAGLAGGFAGQKLQNAILPDATNKQLEEEAARASEEHPVISGATDITAAALAGGGRLSPRTLLRAGRGLLGREVVSAADVLALDSGINEAISPAGKAAFERSLANRQALRNVALSAGINPAIDTGVSLATGGGIPSPRRLLTDVAGGALFSQPSKLGKKFGMHEATEPKLEVSEPTQGLENIQQKNEPKELTAAIKPVKLKTREQQIEALAKTLPKDSLPVPAITDITKAGLTEAEKAALSSEDLTQYQPTEEDKAILSSLSKEGQTDYNKWVNLKTSEALKKDGYYATVQPDNGVPGSGYVQVDIVKNGENLPLTFEEAKKQGIELPNKEDLFKLGQGKHFIGELQETKPNAIQKPIEQEAEVPKESEEVINAPPNDIHNNYSYQLTKHIGEGKATTKSVLDALASLKDNKYSDLAQHLSNIADKESLSVPWKFGSTHSYYRLGSIKAKTPNMQEHVNLDIANFNEKTVIEEAVHSLTAKKLRMFRGLHGETLHNKLQDYIKSGDNESIKGIAKAYLKSAEYLGYNDVMFKEATGLAGIPNELATKVGWSGGNTEFKIGYAMGNLDEFVAHAFKTPTFQRVLDQIPSDIQGKSVWQTILDAVKKIFGVKPKQGHLLEEVLNHSSELISQERPPTRTIKEALSDETLNAPPDKIEETDTTKKGFLRPLEATFDKVDRDSKLVGEAGRRWEKRKDQFLGMRNAALVDLHKFSRETVNSVMAKHREAFRTSTEPTFTTPEEREISQILQKYYGGIGQTRRDIGLKIDNRKAGLNPYYVPDQLSDRALDLFVNKTLTPEAQHAKNVWIDHVFRESGGTLSKEAIRNDISDYIAALGGKNTNYNSVKFGAIRRAQGHGLPEGLRDTDAISTLQKYGSRAASDLAMYMELEKNPVVAASLKLDDPNTGKLVTHPEANTDLAAAGSVRDMMKWVTGSFAGTMSMSMPKVNAVVRLINNALLGTATGLRDTVQMPVFAAPYINRFSDLSAAIKGILNYRNESRNALLTGAKKPSMDKYIFNDILEAPDRFSAIVNKIATGMRSLQGREAIENFNRDITFSVGKELARNNIIGAKAGDKKAIAFLERFGTLVDKNPLTTTGPELESVLNQMAKNFTDVNQGSYGGSGLPVGIVESQFAPFFALQKWSVEKSNVIYKDVIKPALTGENYTPLLVYTLGTVVSGAAIQELNQLLSGRKSQDPTIKEALDKGDTKSIVGELATLMQLASFGGIVGDGLKWLSDSALYGKTPRNIVSFPTATAALDLQEKTTDMLEALRLGEHPWDVLKSYTMDLLTHNVQALRMAANHTIQQSDLATSDEFRDLKVFNQLEGGKAADYTPSNKYVGLEAKDYKKTSDVQEAIAQLPALLQKAITDSKGDPYALEAKLRSLKGNSFQIMPNMASMPMKFLQYIEYLRSTQGDAAASQRLAEYLTQSVVNKAKSSLIP